MRFLETSRRPTSPRPISARSASFCPIASWPSVRPSAGSFGTARTRERLSRRREHTDAIAFTPAMS